MICVKLAGGLGNQMFQYAAGRALALRHNTQLLLDLTWYSDMTGCTPRGYGLGIFPFLSKSATIARQISIKELNFIKYNDVSIGKRIAAALLRKPRPYGHNVYIEPYTHYWQKIEELCPPVYLEGYWQSVRYFDDCEETIRRDFIFPRLSNDAAMAIQNKILCTKNSVALHVRRGDYANNPTTHSVHGLCSPQYYSAALNYIKAMTSDAQLFIFSDDPEWVRKEFKILDFSTTIVDIHSENNAYNDMHLMSLCTYHIIANSS